MHTYCFLMTFYLHHSFKAREFHFIILKHVAPVNFGTRTRCLSLSNVVCGEPYFSEKHFSFCLKKDIQVQSRSESACHSY